MSGAFTQALLQFSKKCLEGSDSFPIPDTHPGPWDDPYWSVEEKSVSHLMPAGEFQSREEFSSLHGGEC